MYSKKMSATSSLTIALVVFYFVDQASALKCYYCESFSTGSCWINSISGITQTCDNGLSLMLDSSVASNATLIRTAIASSDDGIAPRDSGLTDCAKFIGTLYGQKYIAKMCAVKSVSCESYEHLFETKVGFKLQSCHRCNGDFCNSSNNLNVGTVSLAISTAMLFFFRI